MQVNSSRAYQPIDRKQYQNSTVHCSEINLPLERYEPNPDSGRATVLGLGVGAGVGFATALGLQALSSTNSLPILSLFGAVAATIASSAVAIPAFEDAFKGK